jgi:hypothetical protein
MVRVLEGEWPSLLADIDALQRQVLQQHTVISNYYIHIVWFSAANSNGRMFE